MPHELVVSNVDIAAAICDVASVTPPSDYVLDGHSYVQDASESDNRVASVDIFNSCSIINGVPVHLPREPQLGGGQERGVFRVCTLYDEEQLYDLATDPNQSREFECDV